LRARVLGFDVTPPEPGTAGEFENGYAAPSDAHFLAPGVIRLSVRSRPDATVVAHECGHAVTTLTEWTAREREIDGEWASEGCANRYVLKWGFDERALRRIVHVRRNAGIGSCRASAIEPYSTNRGSESIHSFRCSRASK
jgi:hypothetical protein